MRYTLAGTMIALFWSLFATTVNAHFQLQFPPPRGPFNAPNEVQFCDGYPTPAANRTQFPLSNGYVTLRQGHPSWTAGILVSSAQNPTAFENFTLFNGFSKTDLPGNYCLPLDFSTSNTTSSFQAGQNVTIQLMINGGDGNLYQCADLALVSSLDLSSTVQCKNTTVTPTSSGHSQPSTTASSASLNYVRSIMALTALAGFMGLFLL